MDIYETSRLMYVYILRFKVLNSPANNSIRINFPDDKHVTFFMLRVPYSVCNVLQVHYEQRALGRKVYRVYLWRLSSIFKIHMRNICVVECISVQSYAIKV